MVKNIPNKYTQEMLLQEITQNYENKFDFFYLPIDKDVLYFLFRMIVMWVMLLSISQVLQLWKTFTLNSMVRNGNVINHQKFVTYAMLVIKELYNWLIISNIQKLSIRRIGKLNHLLGSLRPTLSRKLSRVKGISSECVCQPLDFYIFG